MTILSAIRQTMTALQTSSNVDAINNALDEYLATNPLNRNGYAVTRAVANQRAVDLANAYASNRGLYTELGICFESDEIHDRENMQCTHDGDLICDRVYERDYFSCTHCSEIFSDSDATRAEDNGESYCETCRGNQLEYCNSNDCYYADSDNMPYDDDEEDESDDVRNESGFRVWNHSRNVFTVLGEKFLSTDREANPLFLGVELEVVPKRSRTDSLAKVGPTLSDFAIFKEDGSLDRGGFEIVTLPASLSYHRNAWRQFFSGPNRSCSSYTTECCGLHVHISRDHLTSLEVGKFIVFYNDKDNAEFLSDLAGRNINGRWCSQKPKKLADGVKRIDDDRYQATNMSSSTDGATIEVRIFRGNVSEFGFFRCLELVAATAEFVKHAAIADLNRDGFLQWFDRPNVRSNYPALWRSLTAKGHLSTKHKRKADAPAIDFDESLAA